MKAESEPRLPQTPQLDKGVQSQMEIINSGIDIRFSAHKCTENSVCGDSLSHTLSLSLSCASKEPYTSQTSGHMELN